MQKYSRRRSLLISSNDDIIERIPPMLEKHNNAVWCWQIEADYIDKYNEQLPPDWLRVIDNSSHVSIEKCLGGYVLKHCNPDDVSIEFSRLVVLTRDVKFVTIVFQINRWSWYKWWVFSLVNVHLLEFISFAPRQF
jgi:hypothetical protein